MNITLIVNTVLLVAGAISVVRGFYTISEVINSIQARLGSNFDQVQKALKKFEMVQVELLRIQDKLGVLQREVYRKNKPKTKTKPVKEKAPKKTKKCPEITVDAIAIEEIK